MKILYHSRTFATGGGRVHIDEIVKNLKKLGNEVTLIERSEEHTSELQSH